MKYLIDICTTIGVIIFYLAFLALACYLHDSL